MGAIDGLTWSRRQRDVKESTAVDDVSAGAFQCNALVDCYRWRDARRTDSRNGLGTVCSAADVAHSEKASESRGDGAA